MSEANRPPNTQPFEAAYDRRCAEAEEPVLDAYQQVHAEREALRAENERLRSERDEAMRLLLRMGGGPHQLSMVPYDLRQEVRAFLAARVSDTEGRRS